MYTSALLNLLLFNFADVVTANAIPTIPEVYRRFIQKRDDPPVIVTGPINPWGPLLTPGSKPNWMASLADSTPLTMINMPGTHDSMTGWLNNASYEVNPSKTQLSIVPTQLGAGIRFIDIRCHHINNEFQIWHAGPWANTGRTFTDVITGLAVFLRANPTEAIIMRVHNENDWTFDSNTNTRTFGETYDWYQNTNPDTKTFFTNRQYQGTPFTSWPTLGAVRGKFIVLVDFDASPYPKSKYGYTYPAGTAGSSSLFDIEDQYNINSDISEKWNAVTTHLTTVAASTNTAKMYLTYCSGTSDTNLLKFTPYHVAIEDTVDTPNFQGINQQLWPTMPGRTGRLGIVIFDYPGQDLVDSIIAKN